jgi:hypothetical protein
MGAKECGVVIIATACVSLLSTLTTIGTLPGWIQIVQLAIAVGLIALLLRTNRYAMSAFVVAASVVVANQMLLGYGYLTFLNAGQAFSASSLGVAPASIAAGSVVAAITAVAFYVHRSWVYLTVIVLLIAVTWPTSLSGLSI